MNANVDIINHLISISIQYVATNWIQNVILHVEHYNNLIRKVSIPIFV